MPRNDDVFSTFFSFFGHAKQQNNAYQKKREQKQDGMPHGFHLIDHRKNGHSNNNPYFFGHVIKAKVRRGIIGFWQKFGIGRSCQCLYATHNQPHHKRRNIKLHGRNHKISIKTQGHPYRINNDKGIDITKFSRSTRGCFGAKNSHQLYQ